MDVLIERARPDDADAILHLKREAWLATYVNTDLGYTREDIDKKLPESSLPASIENWRKGISQEKEDGDHMTFVARLGGEVVGYAAPRVEDGQRRVGALYVHPEHHTQGVGGKLLGKVVSWWGRDQDIYLHVVAFNQNAITFYERHGFQKTGNDRPEEFDEAEGIKLLPEIEMILPAEK